MPGFFFPAEDGIRDYKVTGVQTCALPICFYTTRILAAYMNEAGRLLDEGAGVEAIDKALLEFGFPVRSEERRVGKEGGSVGGPEPEKDRVGERDDRGASGGVTERSDNAWW